MPDTLGHGCSWYQCSDITISRSEVKRYFEVWATLHLLLQLLDKQRHSQSMVQLPRPLRPQARLHNTSDICQMHISKLPLTPVQIVA